jgi:hypothetical protein
MMKYWYCSVLLITLSLFSVKAQAQLPQGATITGNFEVNGQYYRPDSAINAPEVPEKVLDNSFMLLNLQYGKFRAGMRFESYQNPLLGFSPRYAGSGIPYRYASFVTENLEVTAGNFYDQFGNGLIFRSYEERQLGIDNAMDGIRVAYTPAKGVRLKGVMGYQRLYWERSTGIVRGADAEVQLNDAILELNDSKMRVTVGGSVVSKYQKDEDPLYRLPENVAALAGRTTINYGKFTFDGEYAYKYNDPSDDNGYIYKIGQAMYLNAMYNVKGLGIRATAKWIDNMSFRSDRNAKLNDLSINYLPAISKQYFYRLSTLYPYATQPNGESAYSAELYYLIKPGSKLGGKYGTNISINGSSTTSIKKNALSNDTLGYSTPFMSSGDNVYYQDFNFEASRRLSKNSKLIVSYIYQVYDKVIIEQEKGEQITAHTAVLDYTYKINKKNSIRFELQHLYTEQERKSWAMALVEYSISPNWSFTVFDEYNYGNEDPERRFHYYNFSGSYTKGGTRISAGYVRQRAGLLCVGGVCRLVPASNGVNLTITSRF